MVHPGGTVGQCKLKPVQAVLTVPDFSFSYLNPKRLLSSFDFAFHFNLHRPSSAHCVALVRPFEDVMGMGAACAMVFIYE